jgi:hypothetical protein
MASGRAATSGPLPPGCSSGVVRLVVEDRQGPAPARQFTGHGYVGDDGLGAWVLPTWVIEPWERCARRTTGHQTSTTRPNAGQGGTSAQAAQATAAQATHDRRVFAVGGHLGDGLVEAAATIEGEQHGLESASKASWMPHWSNRWRRSQISWTPLQGVAAGVDQACRSRSVDSRCRNASSRPARLRGPPPW